MLGMQITLLAVYCNKIRCVILYGDINHISYAPTKFIEHSKVASFGFQFSNKLIELKLHQYKVFKIIYQQIKDMSFPELGNAS